MTTSNHLVQITAISHLSYFMGSWRNSQCLALSPLTLKRAATWGLAEMFNHTMSLFCPRPSDLSLRGRAKPLLRRCRPGSAWVCLTSSPAPHYPCSLVSSRVGFRASPPTPNTSIAFALQSPTLAVPSVWNSLSKTFAFVPSLPLAFTQCTHLHKAFYDHRI